MNNRILSYAVVVMIAFAVTSCKQKAADKVSLQIWKMQFSAMLNKLKCQL